MSYKCRHSGFRRLDLTMNKTWPTYWSNEVMLPILILGGLRIRPKVSLVLDLITLIFTKIPAIGRQIERSPVTCPNCQ